VYASWEGRRRRGLNGEGRPQTSRSSAKNCGSAGMFLTKLRSQLLGLDIGLGREGFRGGGLSRA
jgi:hypothetical protein